MKQVQKNSFNSYILSDQVWWYNITRFLSYSKNYICKCMQANSWHHKLFYFYLSFWMWKVWKEREKITKIWLSPREWKELFRWIKNIIWWKNKNLTKKVDTSFKAIAQNSFSFCKSDYNIWFCKYESQIKTIRIKTFDLEKHSELEANC